MANYLDKTGLALVWEKIKNLVGGKVDKVDGKGLSSNDYTSDEKTKLANIASGAQVNVLEGIQKNGQTVTIANKIANISVPTATSELTNDSGFITSADVPEGAAASTTTPKMDGTAAVGTETAFARGDHRHPTDTSRAAASDVTALAGRVGTLEDAVGDGGDIDTRISDAIGGLDSSITAETGKAIASVTITNGKITGSTKVTVPTNTNQLTNGAGFITSSSLPTKVSDLTNDSGFQTSSQVSSAIATAIGDLEGVSFSIVQSLPATGDSSVIYLVPDAGGSGNDVYDEFIWLSSQTKFEKIGRTDVDLSSYYNTTNLVAITSTEIDTVCV